MLTMMINLAGCSSFSKNSKDGDPRVVLVSSKTECVPMELDGEAGFWCPPLWLERNHEEKEQCLKLSEELMTELEKR